MKRERLFAKTLPPLKKAIEAKVEKDFEEKQWKEKEEMENKGKEDNVQQWADKERRRPLQKQKRKIVKDCMRIWRKHSITQGENCKS